MTISPLGNACKRILFLTGTRADFGKLKPLIRVLSDDPDFDVHVFITGMHMLSRYGYTCMEVEKSGFQNLHKFFNQNLSDGMDHVLGKTILGLSDYVHEIRPDMMIYHGDRVEALAGATVGALNNIRTSHVEGGEISGTIDDSIRHAVTKLSHLHFVAHDEAKSRLIQLGEPSEGVYIIGSPDIDVMDSPELPTLEETLDNYEIEFEEFGIVILHPVTTESREQTAIQAKELVDALLESHLNYVVIYPNNDTGSKKIFDEYERLANNEKFRIFPSIRFESFLTLLKFSSFIIGNSSAGIREAPHFGTPTINLGSRQSRRGKTNSILNIEFKKSEILRAIDKVVGKRFEAVKIFGNGNSAEKFHAIMKNDSVWAVDLQKSFVDL